MALNFILLCMFIQTMLSDLSFRGTSTSISGHPESSGNMLDSNDITQETIGGEFS